MLVLIWVFIDHTGLFVGFVLRWYIYYPLEFLLISGLGVEGIFRVNGNARIVEKLKTSFDLHGDANLDEDNDILAVAGLLKLFLREMPDSVIPEHMTRQFLDVQERKLTADLKPLKHLPTL